MDLMTDTDLMESMLNTAASMEVLSGELDRISLHSYSESRESLHSSSKYDSAFDSHYSEDTNSINSQRGLRPGQIETPFYNSTPNSSLDRVMRGNKQPKVNLLAPSSPTTKFGSTGSSTDRGYQTSQRLPRTDSKQSSHHVIEIASSLLSPLQAEVVNLSVQDPSLSPASSLMWHDTTLTQDEPGVNVSGASTPKLKRPSSSGSSTGASRTSSSTTPTLTRRHDNDEPSERTPPVKHKPLTPLVTIIYPNDSDSDNEYIPKNSPQQSHIPKRGTVFYQDSLTLQHSPLHKAHRKNSHVRDRTHISPRLTRRKMPTRNPSILQRLIRKRGSFKEEGLLKRRLPVKRSLSDRITYHIRKGWIDYEEDLNFISQPSQPRAVGRMVDKKGGRYHMVQLYRPPSGRYGIYISETAERKGVFISRFANSTAAKFYSGLIRPGDQVIRVNGKNISEEQSVDDVYDLMTASDSVIFTVIPITTRADW